MKKALIIGDAQELTLAMPYLLRRLGFVIDVMDIGQTFKGVSFINNCEDFSSYETLMPAVISKDLSSYDFIVVCSDLILKNILESEIPLLSKLKLLPVISERDCKHIASKIDLSEVLMEAGVNTPQFFVVKNIAAAVLAAEKLGYPVMIKVDFSGGGDGTFQCDNLDDIYKINPKVFDLPILVQKKIEGAELDLSGLYINGELISFSYSKIKKVISNKFGPSSLRLYRPLSLVDESVFLAMKKLGTALGANGFATISAIESSVDKKYIFLKAI